VHVEHDAILRAIIARDSERARAAMLLHLRNAADDLGPHNGRAERAAPN
jgi:DNA-binding FadR family transcriptional regulator